MVDNLGNDDYDIAATFGLDLSAGGSFSFNALPTTPEGLIASANVSGDVQGVLTAALNQAPALSALGQTALNAMGNIVQKVAMAAPAIDLISSIATGHGPTDPQQAVGALAATASIANPLAGAIIGAAGEAAIGIEELADQAFQALGLISRPPPQFTYVGFVKKGDPVPGGPWHPNWKTWDYWMQPFAQGWKWGTLPFTAETIQRERPFQLLLERLGRYHPPVPTGIPPHDGPKPQNGFETFYFTILKKNLENWMNAGPAIDPRELLQAAAQVWNAKHTSISTKKYSGFTSGGSSYDNSLAHPIDFILSAAGDTSDRGMQGFGSDAADITINLGDFQTPSVTKTTLSLTGLGRAPTPILTAPKRAFSLAGRAASVMAPSGVRPAAITAPQQSLLQKLLPYAPAAAGVVALPFIGPIALVGVVASALIIGAKRA